MKLQENMLKDQIIIKNLRIKGKLGPDAWISSKEQFLVFNIVGSITFKNSDELNDTISYSHIASHIESFIENQNSTDCLRSAAAKIAYDCLSIFGLEEVTVKIDKQHALLHANSVGIEIKRCQGDMERLKEYKMDALVNPWNTSAEDCIFISKMLIYCIIGVNDCERLEKQKVLISLQFYFPASDTDRSRNNYRFISSLVLKFVENSSYKTLEKMAIDLCDLILQRGRTSKVTVYIEKPSALRLADSSGVQITRADRLYDVQQSTHLRKKDIGKFVAYIGLGTNLGDRLLQIHQALSLLQNKGIRIIDTSFLYETGPMYVTEQPKFLNGCLKVIFYGFND
jgi:dihydroneopterin aldolase/2-amino-4-hydroxy-6-hydroxymethyldihydropteridine diphosphokinase/dihydropteroate synthase